MEGIDWGFLGSQFYAYMTVHNLKERIGWTMDVYGELRPDPRFDPNSNFIRATPYWSAHKWGLRVYASALLRCDQDEDIPGDECLP